MGAGPAQSGPTGVLKSAIEVWVQGTSLSVAFGAAQIGVLTHVHASSVLSRPMPSAASPADSTDYHVELSWSAKGPKDPKEGLWELWLNGVRSLDGPRAYTLTSVVLDAKPDVRIGLDLQGFVW